MKRTISFIYLLLPLWVFAQKIIVSEDMPLRSDLSYEIIGELKEQMLLFKNQTTDFEVQAFNKYLKETWTKELDFEKKTIKVLGITSNKEDFTLFYTFRKKGKTILKANKYDAGANLKDSITIKDYGFMFFTPEFEIIRSEDRSKVLLFFIEKQDIVRTLSFDVDSLQMRWEKDFKLDDFYYSEDFEQMIVSNEGDMYMILDRDNFRSKRKDHLYEIYHYSGQQETLNQFKIPFRDMLTIDIYFNYDNLNKRIIAGGLHSEKDLTKAIGYFYLSVDPMAPTNHILVFEEFDPEFVSNLLGKKKVDKNRGIEELSAQEIVLRRDGGILLIAERTRFLERRSGNSGRVYYDNQLRFIADYYFDELMIVSIHPTGKTHWKTILHKKQYSQDDNGAYSSYFLFKTASNLRFLFNDDIRQENTVSEYVLNGIGEYDRNSILSTRDLELRLRFRDALQLGANEMIIPSERRNKLKLVKLEY
ncbi:MAG: hypothetical protein R2828_12965 [Saprospiraceae bacterium]